MTDQPNLLMASAHRRLEAARRIFQAGVHDVAAREAYLAALSATRAMIFASAGKAPKTHRGSIALFHETVIKPGAFDRSLATFLAEGLEIKQSVDYEPLDPAVDPSRAEAMLHRAELFIAAAETYLHRQTGRK